MTVPTEQAAPVTILVEHHTAAAGFASGRDIGARTQAAVGWRHGLLPALLQEEKKGEEKEAGLLNTEAGQCLVFEVLTRFLHSI